MPHSRIDSVVMVRWSTRRRLLDIHIALRTMLSIAGLLETPHSRIDSAVLLRRFARGHNKVNILPMIHIKLHPRSVLAMGLRGAPHSRIDSAVLPWAPVLGLLSQVPLVLNVVALLLLVVIVVILLPLLVVSAAVPVHPVGRAFSRIDRTLLAPLEALALALTIKMVNSRSKMLSLENLSRIPFPTFYLSCRPNNCSALGV